MIELIENHPFLSLFITFWALLLVIFLVCIVCFKDEMIEMDEDEWE